MGQRAPTFRSVAGHRDNVSSPCAGHRAPFSRTQHRLHEEVVGFMRYESYGKAIGPPARRCRSAGKTLRICVFRALDDGKMLARCVPQRPTVTGLRPNALLAWLAVAIYSRGAFSGALPWQDFTTVRSRAAIRGKFCAPCIPKVASDGKIASSWQHIAAVYSK